MVSDKSIYSKFILREPFKALQLIPDKSLRNYNTRALALAMSEFYKKPIMRFSKFKILAPDTFVFRSILTKKEIIYFLFVPERLYEYFFQKARSVWEKATVIRVNPKSIRFDLSRTRCCELFYKRHDMFSLNTNKDESAPMPSLLAIVNDMKDSDTLIIDSVFQATDRIGWEYEANKAWNRFQDGRMPRPTRSYLDPNNLIKIGIGSLISGIGDVQKILITGLGGSFDERVGVIDAEREALYLNGLSNSTSNKIHSQVLKTSIRVICQSDSKERAGYLMRSAAGSFKDITQDNELIFREGSAKRIMKEVNNYSMPVQRIFYASVGEAGKFMQLPTAGLQEEFPVTCVLKREVSLPDELFLENTPGISIGKVTERGITRLAKIPLVEYPGVKRDHVYDALCTATLVTGQVGSGKTEGMGGNFAHAFLKNGFSVFMIDSADGEQARKLEDSLPEDFPDEKIIHLEFDNKHYPIALNWNDSASRKLDGEYDELEIIEMGETLTSRLIDYIDQNASELTERMRRFLTSCSRVVFQDSKKSLLDIELLLRSPTYRTECMTDPVIQQDSEIMQDLGNLQSRAESESDLSITDPIVNRLKIFTATRAMQSIFYQTSKLDKNGKPLLDFRKFADNPEGGYGYLVCIHASYDAWGRENQEILLNFLQDKILMAIYSRVDIPQNERKPCLNLVDEPHRFINRAWKLYNNASVELRKYRMKLLWLAHYMSQMGPAAQAVASGGCQFTQYKTQDLKQFSELGHVFDPYTAEELYKSLPEKWEAVNKIRLPSGKDCPAFIAQMEPPPKFVRSRHERRAECAKIFGRHWKEVYNWIQNKRTKYYEADELWFALVRESKKKKKEKV
jgi:hypothetical protein